MIYIGDVNSKIVIPLLMSVIIHQAVSSVYVCIECRCLPRTDRPCIVRDAVEIYRVVNICDRANLRQLTLFTISVISGLVARFCFSASTLQLLKFY